MNITMLPPNIERYNKIKQVRDKLIILFKRIDHKDTPQKHFDMLSGLYAECFHWPLDGLDELNLLITKQLNGEYDKE